MAQNNREKDWDEYASSLKQENPYLDPPGYGGDALPSGSSSENVSQGESRFLTKLFQTVLANPVLDASKALKTPQERRAEFEAARRLQNELGLDALEANRRVRAQRDAEYRRTGTESLRRLLEEAYGLDLGSGTPPPVSNAGDPNLRLPGFPDLSEAMEAQMLRDLDTSAIAEQNRRFGKKTTQPRPIPTRKNGKLQNGYYSIDGIYLGTDGEYDEKVYVVVENLPGPPARPTIINGVLKLPPGMKELPQLTHSELLDRIRWIYGEGGGEFPDAYAHAIQNGMAIGFNALAPHPFNSQDDRFRAGMGPQNFLRFKRWEYGQSNNDYNQNYANLNKFKDNPQELNKFGKVKAVTTAVLKERLGLSQDPINGAYQWRGSATLNPNIKNGELYLENKAFRYQNVTVFPSNGRFHYFFSLKKA